VKVLVTGGAGYVGTELVNALAGRAEVSEIIVYDNLSRRNYNLFISEKMHPGKPIRFVLGDILDTRKLGGLVADVDAVVHLAARVTTPFADSDFHGLDQVNHWGTAELGYLLERQRAEGGPVQKLIYLSSTSVYGASDEAVTLATPAEPKTAYGISKHRGERMLERLGDQMGVYLVRCGNVYGYSKSMRFDAVINRFMFEAQFNGRITVHGTGRQRRAFVHVQTVARALAGMLLGATSPGPWNLVERNLEVLEIASYVRDLYPRLEMLFLQQDITLRNLEVAPDHRLDPDWLDPRSFAAQLREFKAHFAFAPTP